MADVSDEHGKDVINSSVIWKSNTMVLYSLITFGVSWVPDLPSPYDPPDHLMRIRLVCTLLDTCAQFFSSGSSKRRLDCFITYFQYYVWYKKVTYPADDFPWQMDHLIRDSLSGLRNKLKIFKCFNEAQEAVSFLNKQIYDKAVISMPSLREFEENDENLETIREDEVAGETESENMFIEIDDDEDDARGACCPDAEESDLEIWNEGVLTSSEHSQSMKLQANEENEEDRLSENRESLERSADVISLTIDIVHCPEDDDFMSEFDKMLSDNLLERSRGIGHGHIANISVPVHVRSSAKKTYEQIMSETAPDVEISKPVVNFVLLTKSGSKQQCSSVEMPVDSDLVMKLRSREEAERMERDRVKQLTLEINERQEEEEALEMMQQAAKPSLYNQNRERKPRYQHPRGVPDADLIFGSKKLK